jgi:hypothetical protein
VRLFELPQGLLDLGQHRVGIDGGMQRRRDVLGRAVDALHVLEQADGLRHGCASGWFTSVLIAAIFPRISLADVAGDEVVDLVDGRQLRRGLFGELHARVDEELLRELDDGAVRAADVLARAALGAKPRDDLDDQVDLVGQQRVEVDEASARARAA